MSFCVPAKKIILTRKKLLTSSLSDIESCPFLPCAQPFLSEQATVWASLGLLGFASSDGNPITLNRVRRRSTTVAWWGRGWHIYQLVLPAFFPLLAARRQQTYERCLTANASHEEAKARQKWGRASTYFSACLREWLNVTSLLQHFYNIRFNLIWHINALPTLIIELKKFHSCNYCFYNGQEPAKTDFKDEETGKELFRYAEKFMHQKVVLYLFFRYAFAYCEKLEQQVRLIHDVNQLFHSDLVSLRSK